MDTNFNKIQNILLDLDYNIVLNDSNEGVFIIEKLDEGINKLVIICEESIVILEQFIFEIKNESTEMYKSLLMKNRDIIHGAFVIDESGKGVIFRDTLQIENIDRNELEGSINALSVLLSEYTNEIINFSK
ncbi:MAG: hypothetical protein KAG84_03300 [Bacteroidales bacterium]|nr:hypothetical protein [Bacteroidales bacterium]